MIPSSSRGYGNNCHQASSVGNPIYQGRSEARPFRPVGQYRPVNSTSSAYRGYGNTGYQAYQWRSETVPFRPVEQYRPGNSISRSEAGPFRPVGQYRPENSISRSEMGTFRRPNEQYRPENTISGSKAEPFRPIEQYRPQNSILRSEAGPFRPAGQYRPGNSTSGSYRGYGNTVHQSTHQWRSEEGSLTREGYRGRGAHQNSDTNAYYVSNNRAPQRGSNNFLHPVTEDWRLNGWSMSSGPTNYMWSSGPTQHPNPPLSANPGRGRGVGRSRGWYATNLES